MKCPQDGTTLTMADRNGVEIDYCPTCRGVWLDRGELDKIIDRAGTATPAIALTEPARAAIESYSPARDVRQPERRRDDDDHRSGYDDDDHHRRPKRRESFLSDLFDF